MIVHTVFDKVENGEITAVTLNVIENDTIIQRGLFDILKDGTLAKVRSNQFLNKVDKFAIRESIKQITEYLKMNGIECIVLERENRNYIN